ncbi:MAG: hypothetical protein K9N47_05115 [Prosthecobacter sp.]|uniref:hypothetical protein n=1 Tax=Prosthecobacter sp. TaxID=1965333 RepID=UPI0025E56F99|nr:hypothetical protein [Prosthecobacter sp.]MCF7785480.1 hypothetical protein [Prosthecobacter sp.]
MSYQASIHHLTTGRFLMECLVEGRDLREAENAAIARAAHKSRALPREMDVRHLHQCMERRNPTAAKAYQSV